MIQVPVEAVSLDSTVIPVQPDGTGAAPKNGPQSMGKSRGGWSTKIDLLAAEACTAVKFSLSPGEAGDAPHGRKLLPTGGLSSHQVMMDRAYEIKGMRRLHWCRNWRLHRWYRPSVIALPPGTMTAHCRKSAMR